MYSIATSMAWSTVKTNAMLHEGSPTDRQVTHQIPSPILRWANFCGRRGTLSLLFLLLISIVLPVDVLGQSTTSYQYVYDNSGQLIEAVDSSGNTVTYTYDPAGNLLSITRGTLASQGGLAIVGFSPQQGVVGSTANIYGQNFSPTPSSNKVQFNGTTATVTAATSTSLTVTVPAGATTGPITVIVGSATSTSSNSFSVVTVPVISSISPVIAVQGQQISNFQVTGHVLSGATFSFVPVFSPPAITSPPASISSDGTSATLDITIASNAVPGTYTIVATANGASSSQIAAGGNTLTVLSTNPSADADGDGLTNIYEEAIGTNPLNPSTSGDGIPDGWAVFFGLNPLNPGGGAQIAPDGLTYLQAYQQGLNPLSSVVPPAVSSVSPTNGSTLFSTNTVIVVRFDEPLQAPVTLPAVQNAIQAGLPLNSTFSGSNLVSATNVLQRYLLQTCCGGTAAVPGTVQLLQGSLPIGGFVTLSNDGLSLVFTPTQALSSSTTYTVLVQGVKAESGEQMIGTFQSTFVTGLTTSATTGESLLTSPANGATDVPINTAFMVQFSEQVDPATLTPQTFYLTDAVTGQTVPGTLQTDPSDFNVTFVPQAFLSVGRQYSVTLTSGILNTTQNPFPGASYNFTTGFATQMQGPTVTGVSPANAATGVPLNSLVVAQFNEPVDVISAITGFQFLQGGNPVPGAIALSNGSTQLTFTPLAALAPATMYTIAVASQITDVAGNRLMNPGTFTFTTGAASDGSSPSVATVSPLNNAAGVPTNAVVQLQFSKQLDPLTVTTSDFYVYPLGTGIPIAGTVVVAPNGLTATFTPAEPLLVSTIYYVQATGSILDLEGHGLNGFTSNFTTGAGTVTSGPVVTSVSPLNGTAGVPVNAQVMVVVSAPVSAASVGSSAITVLAGGTPVTGTISLSSDLTTLTFAPSSLLTTGTTYTVTVGGFTDQAGNAVVPFTSTFMTGTSVVANTTQPTVTAVNPANGANGVSVSSSIVLTFNEALDPSTVNINTIAITASGFVGQLAGSYTLNAAGTVVTFTPVSPLRGNATINITVNSGVQDLSGNPANPFSSSFTTAAGVDTTVPTVLMVTPTNGATGVGLNASVVLTFSKSLNARTLNPSNLALLANGGSLPIGTINVSADNRTVTISTGTLPASTVVTVVATTGVQDLSGNALANFESSFTTTVAFDTTQPAVVTQRPGNGATGVPLSSSVVLYINEPMNAATVQSALHVSQNGVLAAGTTQVSDSGQVVVFTPSAPWQNDALIQVFMDSTAQDVNGNALTAYEGSFTTVASTAMVAPSVVSTSPSSGSLAPTNVVIDIQFNEPLDPSTVNSTTVTLAQGSRFGIGSLGPSAATVYLIGGGTIIQVVPTSQLPPNSQQIYGVQLTGIQGTNGLPLESSPLNTAIFYTGAGPDTTAPGIVSVSPPNGSKNVGDNAQVVVVFTGPINPLTVSATSIQLTGGGTTFVPDSISFTNYYASGGPPSVFLTPHAPLPDNTVMTLTINGITDVAGNVVAPQTTTFTTGTGPDLVAPTVVSENPYNGESGVPLNAPIVVQLSGPIDPGTVNFEVGYGNGFTEPVPIAGTTSVSADGQTITFLPSTIWAVDQEISVGFGEGTTDLSGNPLCFPFLCGFTFTTGTASNATGPAVVGVSPANGAMGVPINAQVVVQFNEPVDALTVNQVTLSSGSPVKVISTLSNANQTLMLVPVVTLAPGTTYTVSVTGVTDLSGNAQTTPFTSTFTTGPGADLSVTPVVAEVSPANGAGTVPTNAAIQLQFSKQVDPLTVTTSDFFLYPPNTGISGLSSGILVAGTIQVTPDGLTATFTPSEPLLASTNYTVQATSGIADLEGHGLLSFFSSFTTGTGGVTTPPVVTAVSPLNGTTGVPVNAQVVVVVSAPVSLTSVGSSAIIVSTSGTPVAGTISQSSDQTTLTFAPSSLLAVSTTYTVRVGGFTDQAGNGVTAFTSTFMTGTSGVANTTQPTVTAVSPVSGTTGVATNSPVVLSFNEVLDAATVNVNTVPVTVSGFSGALAGNYVVSGTTVMFTPVSPLPGNSMIDVAVSSGVLDLSGNPAISFSSSFTTGAATDTTAPTVLMVTPTNGATGVGLNAPVVLTFSKSLNQSTLNTNNLALLANGSRQEIGSISISADNRTVTLNAGTLPASTVVTVVATTGVQDLSGIALANFESSFTTGAAFDTTSAAVVTQRPGNGATAVPTSATVVLYFDQPLNATTVPGAIHVSQNGILASGTTQVSNSGQSAVFTPSAPWPNDAVIDIFMDTTAQDLDGRPLTPYQGSFTTVASTATVAPMVVSTSPTNSSPVPTNVVADLEFNETLNPSTVNNNNVALEMLVPGNGYQPIASTAWTVSLVGGGTIIQITPNALLTANTSYLVQLGPGIQGTNGLPLAAVTNAEFFTTGTAPDTEPPAVVSVSPSNGLTNVGDNAYVRVMFTGPINPLTVNASTIQLTGGGTTAVPDSISFANSDQSVLLVPHAPLPDNTVMTLAIGGVMDAAGNAVVPQTTTFTTGTGPDLVAPFVVNQSPVNGATGVPLNAPIMLQLSEPIDPATLNSTTLSVYNESIGQLVTGTSSVSPDGQTISFVPSSTWTTDEPVTVVYGGATDLAGNYLCGGEDECSFSFTTGTTASTTGPAVVGVSPANGATGAPIDAQIVVQFNEPVDALTVNHVTLSSGGAVSVTSTLTNANQTLTLVPVVTLAPGTTYTVSVTGVTDLSGNVQTAPFTSTFTTGSGADLVAPTVTSANPANNSTTVLTTSAIQITFSNIINALTVTTADFMVSAASTGIPITGTIAVAPGGLTATFTPSSPLSPSTGYNVEATGAILDLEGHSLQFFSSGFTTGIQ
jgi:large repetitive protein